MRFHTYFVEKKCEIPTKVVFLRLKQDKNFEENGNKCLQGQVLLADWAKLFGLHKRPSERRRCRFGVGFYGDVPLKGNVGRTMRELEMKKEKCSQNASILE